MGDIDEDMMDSESESEAEEVALSKPLKKKSVVQNKEGLLEKLECIAWLENVDWIHGLSIDHDLQEIKEKNTYLRNDKIPLVMILGCIYTHILITCLHLFKRNNRKCLIS